MKKNQLLKNVSNVNDVASQVVSPTKGLDGKIKDISVKNGAKNVESIAEKAFKDAITNKTNIDTSNNGQFHTAFNVVDSALTSSVKSGAAINRTTKKIAITLAISLINKYQSGKKDESSNVGDGHVNTSSELQTLYSQNSGNFDKVSNPSNVSSLASNNINVSYKKVGSASASVDGEFINCDVLDSNILVVNYNDKIIECRLNHRVNSDVINESDINMSTVIVSNHNYNMPILFDDDIFSPITPIYGRNVLPVSSVNAQKNGEIIKSTNITPNNSISEVIETPASGGLVQITNNDSPGNINNLIEKNKIKKTNSSNNIMNTNMKLLASNNVMNDIENKSADLSSDKLQAFKNKLINKRKKLDNKHKSSKAANDFSRRVRKSVVNNAINGGTSETENNMSTGMAVFAGDFAALQAKRRVKELTVDKLYNATIGKVMDKVKSGIKRAFAGMAKAIIHFAFMLFQLIVSIIASLAALISPMILLPAIIGAVLIGGVFGGIFYMKVNDEQAARNDSDIRQAIEENEDIFGRFSFDKSNASLGTYQKSYDELKSVFTWMNNDNPYPVKDQAKIITSQYTLHRTDVEGHGVHYGVDFNAPMSSVLVAIADATVEATNTDSGYGNHVILNFGDGTYALYGHMTDFVVDDSDNPNNLLGWRYLKPGDTVKAGEPIGHSGSTGDSTGPHLHLVLATSPYGSESDSRYDFNEYVKAVWCPDFEFSYDYDQTYGIFEDYIDYFKED